MRKTIFFIALMMICLSLFAQEMNEMIILKQAERRTDQIIDQSHKDANRMICAGILIITDLDGLTFQSNMGVVGMDYNPGRYMVFVSEGERVLDIYKTGFKPLEIILSEYGIYGLKSGHVYQLEVTAKNKSQDINVFIKTNPENATIIWDGESKGTNGIFKSNAGAHRLRIEMQGYESIDQDIQVSDKQFSFEYNLKKEEMIPLVISTTPKGATVYIDQVRIPQTTPFSKFYPKGKYDLKIEKDKYVTHQGTIQVNAPKTEQSYTLTPDFGQLSISSLNQSSLEIYINGKPTVYRTPAVIDSLAPNTYQIHAQNDTWMTDVKTIDLQRNKKEIISLQAFRTVGDIKISSEPSGLPIYMNNRLTDNTTPYTFKDLIPSEYSFYVKSATYDSAPQTIKLEKGKTEILTFKAERQVADLLINSTPENGMTVYLNNQKQEKSTPCTIKDLKPGTYTVELRGQYYQSQTKQAELIKGVNQTLSFIMDNNYGQLSIETDAQAQIEINGTDYGTQRRFKFEPQLLDIKISRNKAQTITESVILKNGDNVTKKLYPALSKGSIQVELYPTDASVELSGDAGEKYNSTGMKIFEGIPVGTYTLLVKKTGYKSHRETITLKLNETLARTITLKEGKDVPDNFVLVEGGTFQMGSTNGESDEKPLHSVTLSSFYIGKYEVTQKEWQAVMGSNPSNFKGDKRPVEKISWYDAVEFCNKLSQKEGLTPAYTINGTNVTCNWQADGYRLPTEAEWEFAARGGNKSKGYTYSGSNNLDEVGWYYSNSGSETKEVGTKKANELGIYDMSGNVWEWCWDWKDSYPSSSQMNPKGASSGSNRVNRGGSWSDGDYNCRVARRGHNYPGNSSISLGFRLSRTIR